PSPAISRHAPARSETVSPEHLDQNAEEVGSWPTVPTVASPSRRCGKEKAMKQHGEGGSRKVLKEIQREAGRQAGWRRWHDEVVYQTTRGWGEEFARQLFGNPGSRRRSH